MAALARIDSQTINLVDLVGVDITDHILFGWLGFIRKLQY